MSRRVNIWIVKRDEHQSVPRAWGLDDALERTAIELRLDLTLHFTVLEQVKTQVARPDGVCFVATKAALNVTDIDALLDLNVPTMIVTNPLYRGRRKLQDTKTFEYFLIPGTGADPTRRGGSSRKDRIGNTRSFMTKVAERKEIELQIEDGLISDERPRDKIDPGVFENPYAFMPDADPDDGLGEDREIRQPPRQMADVEERSSQTRGAIHRLQATPFLYSELLGAGGKLIDDFVLDYLNRTGQNKLPEPFEVVTEISRSYALVSSILARQSDKIEDLESEIERLHGRLEQLNAVLELTLNRPPDTPEAKSNLQLMREGFYTDLGASASKALMFAIGAGATFVFGQAETVMRFQDISMQIKSHFGW